MSRKYLITIILSFGITVFSLASPFPSQNRELLRKFFDVSEDKPFFPSESWHLRCVFTQIGAESLLLSCSTSGEDRMGNIWNVWHVGKDRLVNLALTGPIEYGCSSGSFLTLRHNDERCRLLGLGMNAYRVNSEGKQVGKQIPDCEFVLTDHSGYFLQPLTAGFDTLFRRPEVQLVEKPPLEWFLGYEFTPPEIKPYDPMTWRFPYRLPLGDLRVGGGIVQPASFNTFLAEYRRSLNIKYGERENARVYTVFLDADHDGQTEFFITNDHERDSQGLFTWYLYLSRNGTHKTAVQQIYEDSAHRHRFALDPIVKTDSYSFCRMIRYDMPPAYIVISREKGSDQIRKLALDFETYRIEKLPCHEF